MDVFVHLLPTWKQPTWRCEVRFHLATFGHGQLHLMAEKKMLPGEITPLEN